MKNVLFLCALAAALMLAGCPDDDDDVIISSRAYQGHDSDADMNNLVNAYPSIIGTRIDDCQTCHTAGDVVHSTKGTMTLNPCSFCHLIPYPDGDLTSGSPATYADTLNPYGLAYNTAGRSLQAVHDIDLLDSDVDTYGNGVEILGNRYPGDPDSHPGQNFAPIYTFTWTALTTATPTHKQFLLMNSHKQEFDTYAEYTGMKVIDILTEAGVNMTGVTGVTIIAPDGYAKDFTLAEISSAYAPGEYWGNLGTADFTDPAQGFVEYPASAYIPTGISPTGGTLPDAMWIQIAYNRDGSVLDQSYLDVTSGKLTGEGPFRVIVPQTVPGSPDRGSSYSPTTYGDGWDYDATKDHNAGLAVRGIVAIRVNPMPAGFEEFDWKNGGFSYLAEKKLFLYGQGVTAN